MYQEANLSMLNLGSQVKFFETNYLLPMLILYGTLWKFGYVLQKQSGEHHCNVVVFIVPKVVKVTNFCKMCETNVWDWLVVFKANHVCSVVQAHAVVDV